jgi:phage FluMu protein Com
VIRFLAGDTAVHSGVLSNGLLNAINPTKLIEGAIDLPLMAWSRQSDITADRAGLMAVGDEALARRVLLAWSLRSARLLQQINIEEWMKQESASDDQMTRFTEMTTSSSMYTTRRLHLLGQAAREPELMRWSRSIQPIRKALAPPPAQLAGLGVGTVKVVKTTTSQTKVVSAGAPGAVAIAAVHTGLASVPVGGAAAVGSSGAAPALTPADSVRVVCSKCQGAMRIPRSLLQGKTQLNVRCPQCKNVLTLRPRPAASTQASGQASGQTSGQTGAGIPGQAAAAGHTNPVAPIPTPAPQAASNSQVKSAATIHPPAPPAAGAKSTTVAQLPKSAPASTGKNTSVSRTPAPAGRKK